MDKFTKVRNIGKGNMGACALARNNEDGKYYVIKQVDLTRMNKKERQQSLNEARVLSSLRHPNVINYVDSFLAKRSDHLCIVMEFADGGDISSRIKNNYGVNFRETQVLDWFIQLVLSLHYVHQRKILHRDVKTQNVFLTADNVVKLGDFGIARTLSNTYDQAKTFVGTPYYLSPELILERPYDHRSDVWALGVVLYELLMLKHPFNASDMKGLMQRILKVQYDPITMIYSTEVRSIVPRLLMKDPAQRIELADVLRLPVVQRRIMEWLRGDIMPAKYLDAIVNQKLLPNELLGMAQATCQEQQKQHEQQRVIRAKEPVMAPPKEAAAVMDDDLDTDSEGGHTKTSTTDVVLPYVSPHRRTSSVAASGEVRTAPPTAHLQLQTPRSPPGRLTPCPLASMVTAPSHHQLQPESQPLSSLIDVPERRVSRLPSYVSSSTAASGSKSVNGVTGSVVRSLRAPSYKYYKGPTSRAEVVAQPVYGTRAHRSHPPATAAGAGAGVGGGGMARHQSPMPARLTSLDNFYQQLNYYQQHRSVVTGSGAAASGAGVGATDDGRSNVSRQRAAGLPQPPYMARAVAGAGPSPLAHVPASVLSSRRASRKRSEATAPRVSPGPAHVVHYFRSPMHQMRASGQSPQPRPDAASAPDIKAMLQRAAQERAQRRLGGVLQ